VAVAHFCIVRRLTRAYDTSKPQNPTRLGKDWRVGVVADRVWVDGSRVRRSSDTRARVRPYQRPIHDLDVRCDYCRWLRYNLCRTVAVRALLILVCAVASVHRWSQRRKISDRETCEAVNAARKPGAKSSLAILITPLFYAQEPQECA
jgi:hypothetical protein